ncbi:hypothetical protein B0T25DRAFT_550834 [Lasiosphaeria hispida]|uniref:Uncharacterized protein n=1 Tax=Lasiosphaeria hispida TaxID=260671 RepID=A0AAJ0HAJ8_9PEZI|nr:hypothetical protein B0T25DRAFT_550834 [Lasiosphaeria hispida]
MRPRGWKLSTGTCAKWGALARAGPAPIGNPDLQWSPVQVAVRGCNRQPQRTTDLGHQHGTPSCDRWPMATSPLVSTVLSFPVPPLLRRDAAPTFPSSFFHVSPICNVTYRELGTACSRQGPLILSISCHPLQWGRSSTPVGPRDRPNALRDTRVAFFLFLIFWLESV